MKTSPENAADIDAIAAKLRAVPVGQTVEYADLSGVIGRNIQAHRHILDTARKRVEEETGALFEIIRTVGVKRLTTEEVPDVGLASIRKIRRTARRGVARLDRVRVNSLDASEANKIIAHKSQLGAIALVADGRKTQTLAGEVATSGQAVPAGRVLDLFKS